MYFCNVYFCCVKCKESAERVRKARDWMLQDPSVPEDKLGQWAWVVGITDITGYTGYEREHRRYTSSSSD